MKVKKLIKQLKKLDPEALVVQALDPGQNNCMPTCEAQKQLCRKKWNGDVWIGEWIAQEACFDSEEEWAEFKAGLRNCVVLVP